MGVPNILTPILLCCTAIALSSCGSGIVGSVLAGRDNSTTPAPALRIVPNGVDPVASQGPLVWDRALTNQTVDRRVFIDNYQPAPGADFSVVISIPELGLADVQAEPVAPVATFNAAVGSTEVRFVYDTSVLFAGVSDRSQDVAAQLEVRADGVLVAPPMPFKLLAQPRVSLISPLPALVSPLGSTRVLLKVLGLEGLSLATLKDDLTMRAAIVEPEPADGIVPRSATNLVVENDPNDPAARIVSAVIPNSSVPAKVLVDVVSRLRGQSTVANMSYTPVTGVLVPRVGSTDGGTSVALAGTALVPQRVGDDANQSVPDFTAIEIRVLKAGRVTVVPPSQIEEAASNSQRLIFTMPPSPDGRAGPAQVELLVRISDVELTTRGTYSYGDANPCFGPRGACLRFSPVDTGFGQFESLDHQIDDLVSVHSDAGLPSVWLYSALGNGMFQRIGQRFLAGNRNDPAQQTPVGVCVANFDRALLSDVFIVNQGTGTSARHTIMIGQPYPEDSLEPIFGGVAGPAGGRLPFCADLNLDDVPDIVALPPKNSNAPPTLYLGSSIQTLPRQPVFNQYQLNNAKGSFDFITIGDFDGDTLPEVLLASGAVKVGNKTSVRVVVMENLGAGNLRVLQEVLLEVPGFAPSTSSPVVGMHLLRDGSKAKRRPLALVLAGTGSSATPPAVVVVRQDSKGLVAKVASADVQTFAGGKGFAMSVDGDLELDDADELVVAAKDDDAKPLRLFVWNKGRLVERQNAVDLGAEDVRGVRRMEIGYVSTQRSGVTAESRRGLFVTHDYRADGFAENRLSTFIAGQGPSLLPSDGSLTVPVAVARTVLGQFSAAPAKRPLPALDACLAVPEGLVFLVNDGLGVFSEQVLVNAQGLLPRTLTVVNQTARPDTGPQTVGFLAFDQVSGCRLGIVDPDQLDGRGGGAVFLGQDLRLLAPTSLRKREVHPDTRMIYGDVDRDGISDIVVMLVLREAGKEPSEGETLLLFMRGVRDSGGTVFPFAAPELSGGEATMTHGAAASLVMANFAVGTEAQEIAVAITRGSDTRGPGNHVRFYRLEDGKAPLRFVQSARTGRSRVLIAGNQPARLATGDFDANGTVDLAVATEGDDSLRIFLNFSRSRSSEQPEVEIDSFIEATRDPLTLPPGRPTELAARDLNGDGLEDLIVAVLNDGGKDDYSVTYYLNPGIVDRAQARTLPPARTGARVLRNGAYVSRRAPLSMAIGDLNADGLADLMLGWTNSGAGDRNLRIMFATNF